MAEEFNPEQLRASLQPLIDARLAAPESQAYRHFYGLEFPQAAEQRLGYTTVAGYQLALQAWWPEQPRATLLLLHGYYDHVGLYRHLIGWALNMGFAVLACDLPGHGLSSGARASINDFSEYQLTLGAVLAVAEQLQLQQPWHLCGQSTGGAILLDYLLTGKPRPELGETILLAPLVRPRGWHATKLGYQLMKPFVSRIPRSFYANSSDPDFIDFVRTRDPLQEKTLPLAWVGALARWIPRIETAPASNRRLLIVQGDDDLTVDWPHNLAVLRSKFDQSDVLLLPEGRHQLANEAEGVRQRYLHFLTERLG